MRSTEQRSFTTVNGLGIGEETKGNTVQWFTRLLKAHTVWRSGGWQGGHHIEHDDGRKAVMSFYGAGVFEGAHTHLQHMVIAPVELCAEAFKLEELGIPDPLSRITVDGSCIATIPYHRAISRIREISRGADKKGTIGLGVGDALRDARYPDLSIRASELADYPLMLEKIETIRRRKLEIAQRLLDEMPKPWPDLVEPEIALLHNTALVAQTAEAFQLFPRLVQVTDAKFLHHLLNKPGVIVNEVSHGALHHPWYGYVPYVTQIDPTSQDVLSTILSQGYDGKITRVGVIRSFLTKRGGKGPFISHLPNLFSEELDEDNSGSCDWLGEYQKGALDLLALRYVLNFAGQVRPFDGIVLSFLDVLRDRTEWPLCVAYEYQGLAEPEELRDFFELEGTQIVGITVHPNDRDQQHYAHQFRLTELLKDCQPILEMVRATATQSLEDVFLSRIEREIGLPILGKAYGPRVADRMLTQSGSEILGLN